MNQKSAEELCREILENNGGRIADESRKLLLEDRALKELRPQLEFVSRNWRDLTPALISLSCESVGGRREETYDASLAICLMHLSFHLWDDMLDNSRSKLFKPTFFGKFGAGASLIVGGLASAKAFSIMSRMEMEQKKRQTIIKLVWELWTRMAKAETMNNISRTSARKFSKLKMEAADTEICLRIGAVIGNGSRLEIDHLGKYGFYLGVISALWNDFRVSINFTQELAEKVRNDRLTYTLLRASEQSKNLREKLKLANGDEIQDQGHLREIVEDLLAAKAFENTAKKIEQCTEKAKQELSHLNKGKATSALQTLIEAQPRRFAETLSMFDESQS